MKRLSLIISLIAVSAVILSCNKNEKLKADATPAIEKDKAIEQLVKQKLMDMTIEEKAGQMVQITIGMILNYDNQCVDEAKLTELLSNYKIGSILNVPFDKAQTKEKTAEIVSDIQQKSMDILGIPCIFGLDQIHGATYIKDATFFPQEINLAATFNPEHARAMGEILASETRAAMVPWVFSPVMDLSRNPLWSRNWESFGEDPYVQTVMATEEIKAIQGDDPNHIGLHNAGTTIKHYMGYGNPASGKDRTPAYIPTNDLKDKYFRPFYSCIRNGAVSVMVNSASINSIPTHANSELLNGWLKEGANWDGMVISDWADINNFYTRDHIATDKKDALRIGINAGVDMIMETYDPTAVNLIVELVEEGKISMSRLNDAVGRILRLKARLGLFEKPTWDISQYSDFGCKEYEQKAYAAALESEVLLKNENILPLKKGMKILVAGPNANSVRTLNGGWSYTWQGTSDTSFTAKYNTIYKAISQKFGEKNVRYCPGVEYNDSGDWQTDYFIKKADAILNAYWADVVVLCIGENTYCETPGNINNLMLSENQKELVRVIAKTGTPVVLVLNEGRPRVISDIEPLAKAVVDIMLPGNYGADALAALLSGEENFSGKLPFTYPKYPHSLHTYDYKVTENVSTMEGMYNYDAIMDVQWPFGAGLSYTTFEYSNLRVNKTEFTADDTLEFTFNVRNSGTVDGNESILLYSSDIVASTIPDVKRLRAFDKVSLKPGEMQSVTLKVPAHELAFALPDGRWTLEEGDFRFSVSNLNANVKCTKTKVWNTANK